MILTTTRLVLRDFRTDDLDAVHAIFGDPEVRRWEGPALTIEETQEKLQQVLADQQADPRPRYRFALTIPPDDTMRGYMHLSPTLPDIREWEVGWSLQKAYWGHGYAPEAALAMLDFAFNIIKAHRVVAFCHAENQPSFRVMEKIGMQREGLLRETRWLNGGWHNELIYGILEREFTSRDWGVTK